MHPAPGLCAGTTAHLGSLPFWCMHAWQDRLSQGLRQARLRQPRVKRRLTVFLKGANLAAMANQAPIDSSRPTSEAKDAGTTGAPGTDAAAQTDDLAAKIAQHLLSALKGDPGKSSSPPPPAKESGMSCPSSPLPSLSLLCLPPFHPAAVVIHGC